MRAETYAVFDDIDSPVTQSFAFGRCSPNPVADVIQYFSLKRRAPYFDEVSPLARRAVVLDLLCSRTDPPVEPTKSRLNTRVISCGCPSNAERKGFRVA